MIKTITQAARFIDQAGFCLLFPIKGLKLPSLWAAVKASSPRQRRGKPARSFNLAADWDDDALRLWGWKDELPRRRLCYFGKYFRGKQSLISLAFLPCFYRLEENFSSALADGSLFAHHPERQPRDEYAQLYREGKISADAHAVCRQLFRHGPQATLELRHGLGWASKRGNVRFKRALDELQRRLLIVHWGVKAETRAWESVVYQLTPRAFPRAVRASARLSPAEASDRIAAQYRRLVPTATAPDAQRLFGWPRADAHAFFK